MVKRVIPLILSSILLAAHFYRSGHILLVLFCLGAPLLLLIKRPFTLILLQLYAYFGVATWIHTAITIAQRRMAIGYPWIKASFILGAVALFTLLSGLLLNSKTIKARYQMPPTDMA